MCCQYFYLVFHSFNMILLYILILGDSYFAIDCTTGARRHCWNRWATHERRPDPCGKRTGPEELHAGGGCSCAENCRRESYNETWQIKSQVSSAP